MFSRVMYNRDMKCLKVSCLDRFSCTYDDWSKEVVELGDVGCYVVDVDVTVEEEERPKAHRCYDKHFTDEQHKVCHLVYHHNPANIKDSRLACFLHKYPYL